MRGTVLTAHARSTKGSYCSSTLLQMMGIQPTSDWIFKSSLKIQKSINLIEKVPSFLMLITSWNSKTLQIKQNTSLRWFSPEATFRLIHENCFQKGMRGQWIKSSAFEIKLVWVWMSSSPLSRWMMIEKLFLQACFFKCKISPLSHKCWKVKLLT